MPSSTARWIQRGDPYTFRLYAVDGVRTLLDEVEVRAVTLPRPGVGQNAFPLLRQYLGTASGGRNQPGRYRRVSQFRTLNTDIYVYVPEQTNGRK